MKNIITVLVLLIFSACTTMKWKRSYINKRSSYFENKYLIHFDSTYTFIIPKGISGKSLRKATRKQIKHDSKLFEQMYATIPDSTYELDNTVDSFYTNPNKITYIKKHNLQTNGMNFLQQN